MMARSCDEIVDKLVDHADGELPEVESNEIAEHVTRCDRCRDRLDALRQSLALAQAIWKDNEAALAGFQPKTVATGEPVRTVTPWARLALLATAAALLIAVGLHQYPRRERVPPVAPAAGVKTPTDIEYEIARAAAASQLLTAADLLAEQAGGQEYACERYRYIATAYTHSPAARVSLDRLQSLCDERVEQ